MGCYLSNSKRKTLRQNTEKGTDNPTRSESPNARQKPRNSPPLDGNKKGNTMKNFVKTTLLSALLISGGISFAHTVQPDFLNSTTQIEAKSKKDKGVRTYDGFKFAS